MPNNSREKVLISNYARAFTNLVKDENQDHIRKDIDKLKNLCGISQRNIKYFKFTTSKVQTLFIEQIFVKQDYNKFLYNLCFVIASNKKLTILYNILESIVELLDKKDNKLNATVISAINLEEDEVKEIGEILSNSYKKKFTVVNKIDSKLMAGIIIKINSNMYDDSLIRKLDKIQISDNLKSKL